MTPTDNINLERLPEIIAPVYMDLRTCEKRYLVLMGGRNSGKSVYLSQHFLQKIVMLPDRTLGVFRKIARTCRLSVFKRYQSEIARWGLLKLFKINKTNMEMEYIPNGNTIHFLGMHGEEDREKLKSIENITDVEIEEVTEFIRMDVIDIDMIMRGAVTKPEDPADLPWSGMQIGMAFNPFFGTWPQKTYFDASGQPRQDIPDTHVMVTTIEDNPWATEKDMQVLDALKEEDEELWKRYRHALWTRLTGLIYKPPIIETKYPERFDCQGGGIDWGHNDPLVFLHIGVKDQEPYITEKLYQTGLTTEDLIDKYDARGRLKKGILSEVGIPKMFEDGQAIFIHGVSNEMRAINPEAYPIYCDNAEPARILTLQNAGYWAMACPKGPGSVKAGIDFCKGKRIHSRVENIDTNREFELYKWRVDTGGKPIDIPVDLNNHAMDAMRYFLWGHIGKPLDTPHVEVRHIDLVEEFGDDLLPDIVEGW